jgi:hypothetical protein
MFMKSNDSFRVFLNYHKESAMDMKGNRMETILTILVGWILISIPSSLIVGKLLARRSRPTVSTFARAISPLETAEISAISL